MKTKAMTNQRNTPQNIASAQQDGFFRPAIYDCSAYGFLVHPVRGFLAFICFLLLFCAIVSHNPEDLAVLEGGMDVPLKNWIGLCGAHVSRISFYLFGVATYPMLLLIALALVRSAMPFKLERKLYLLAFASVSLALCIWFAMYPETDFFSNWTQNLGIGQYGAEVSYSNLSGGVLGQLFASPMNISYGIPAGFVRNLIGDVGTFIIILALFIPGLLTILFEDWFRVIIYAIRRKSPDFRPYVPPRNAEHEPEDVEEDEEDEEGTTILPVTQPVEQEDFRLVGSDEEEIENETVNEEENEETEENGDEADETEDEGYIILPPGGIPNRASQMKPEPVVPAEQQVIAPPTMTPPQPQTAPQPQPAPQPQVAPQPQPAPQPQQNPIPRPVEPVQPQQPVQPQSNIPIDQYSQHRTPVARQPEPQPICTNYALPPVALLDPPKNAKTEDREHIEKMCDRLQKTLDSFGIDGHVNNIIVGPRVTRFEIALAEGVAVTKVSQIADTIAMKMEARSIRILAPVPGKDAVGVEVPNKESSIVYIRSIMESPEWTSSKSLIPIVLGRDVEGKAVVTDLSRAPHMLIAGSTGSGKSVCMNTLIQSLLFKFTPDELRLILVDPKVVEMEAYSRLPHLITPVVNNPNKVPLALRWGVNEMERRYQVMAKVHQKDLKVFNKRPPDPEPVYDDEGKPVPAKLPFLVIIIDELADIMMTEAKGDVETSIVRIAQKGRAAGVHLVIATQTPRKEIVTGKLKANLPVKIAFKVGTNMDSRVILDKGGAEKLLGQGDLLFNPPGASDLERIQMTLVTDEEIKKVVDFVSVQASQHFDSQVLAEDNEEDDEAPAKRSAAPVDVVTWNGNNGDGTDDAEDMDIEAPSEEIQAVIEKYLQPGDGPLMRKVLELIIVERQASISLFQRRLGIGYNKSAELVDQLERRNIISRPLGGGQKRDILILEGLEINPNDK